MAYILPIFKGISTIFALSAVFTGLQGLLSPISFSQFFGMPLSPNPLHPLQPTTTPLSPSDLSSPLITHTNVNATPDSDIPPHIKALIYRERKLTESYVSLMSVRQLGTGITLLTFAYQNKWTENATILAIIGIFVAGTDGFFLARGSTRSAGIFHAIPGAMISLLAGLVIWYGDEQA